MHRTFIFIATLFAGTISVLANENIQEYTKEFEKTFSVNPEATLEIDLDFSNLVIENWDRNEVQVHGKVSVDARDEERANDFFDKIIVEMYGNHNEVGLSTDIGKNLSSGKSEEFNITFTIKMPQSMGISGRMDFGEADIAVLMGPANLSMGYGSLRATELGHRQNEVQNEFGETEIDYFGGGLLKVSFGDLEVGQVYGDLQLTCSYSDAEIDLIENTCRELDIKNSFGDVDIHLSENANYVVEASSSFGDVNLPSGTNVFSEKNNFTSKTIKGDIGSGDSPGKIVINCEFGDVDFDN